VVSERSCIERGQKDKQRLLDNDRNSKVVISLFNVFFYGLDHLYSILERHLEIKQHQAHWCNCFIPATLLFHGFIDGLFGLFYRVIAVEREYTLLEDAL
jgi:hypothetical protein